MKVITEEREALKPSTTITMPNGGRYIIEEKIAEGGLSLLYTARTDGNGFPVCVKEFFPAKGARRDNTGKCGKKKGRVYAEPGWEERFKQSLAAFQREGELGSAARENSYQVIAFSDCGNGYAIMPRWSLDTCSFSSLVQYWKRTPPTSSDPVFIDLGRLRFSLTAIDSLLTALSAVHNQGMLHLDISSTNVVWSGERNLGNGAAFLTDFGCSVLLADGASFPAEYALSYSQEYAAPEYNLSGASLTRATDLFSVGKLLAFLCFGERAFGHGDTEYYASQLRVMTGMKEMLVHLINKSTAKNPDDRYQTAAKMQEDIQALIQSIPHKAINPDVSMDFTLYSLKSMLEGSTEEKYSWAHELCYRRNREIRSLSTIGLEPITSLDNGRFQSDRHFFECVIPRELIAFFEKKLKKAPDISLRDIMTCNYPREWKYDVTQLLHAYGPTHLTENCRELIHNTDAFLTNRNILFSILSDDNTLKRYYNRCDIGDEIHIGLAIIVLFGLLGNEHFEMMFNNDVSLCAEYFCGTSW